MQVLTEVQNKTFLSAWVDLSIYSQNIKLKRSFFDIVLTGINIYEKNHRIAVRYYHEVSEKLGGLPGGCGVEVHERHESQVSQ